MNLTMRIFLLLLVSLSFMAGELSFAADTLSLDQFLDSVRSANQTLKIAATTIAAGELRSTSPDMAFAPQFFGQAAHTIDEKPENNPLAPSRVEATALSFGIQKLWESGLQSQVNHSRGVFLSR